MLGRANRLNDALADAGDDGLLGGTADEPIELGAHRHAGTGLELNAVLADAIERGPALRRVGAVDDLRIHADTHSINDITAGDVDGRGRLPRQIHAGLV